MKQPITSRILGTNLSILGSHGDNSGYLRFNLSSSRPARNLCADMLMYCAANPPLSLGPIKVSSFGHRA
jgi:hypothetical protein